MSPKQKFSLGMVGGGLIGVALTLSLGFCTNQPVVVEEVASQPQPTQTVEVPTPTPTLTPEVPIVVETPAPVVTPEPEPEPVTAEDEPWVQEPVVEWVQPCTDWLADHPNGQPCKGEPLEWPFSNGETLVCGPDAKPALDYRDDGIGWWAYCEPALVMP